MSTPIDERTGILPVDVIETQILAMLDPGALPPRDRDMWTTPEMYDEDREWPSYSAQQVAQIFFGMTTGWMRKHIMLRHHISMSGEDVVKPPRSKTSNANKWRLYDIEKMAYIFAERDIITPLKLAYVVRMVRLQAQIHGFLSEPELVPVRLSVGPLRQGIITGLLRRMQTLDDSPTLPPAENIVSNVLDAIALMLVRIEDDLLKEQQRLHEDQLAAELEAGTDDGAE